MLSSIGNASPGTQVSARPSLASPSQPTWPSRISRGVQSTIPRDPRGSHILALSERGSVEPLSKANASERISVSIDMEGAQELPGLLMALSKAVVADDKVKLNMDHWSAYEEGRKHALKTGNFEDAKAATFKLLDYSSTKEAEMVDGFKAAGTLYAMRSTSGTLINALPTLFPMLAHQAAPDAALNYAKGRCAAVIGCALAGGIVNIFNLTYILDSHDLLFRYAPNIAPALKTPQFSQIKHDLKDLAERAEKQIDEIKAAQKESRQDPENLALKEKVDTLIIAAHDMIIGGIFPYQTRRQLNTVYFKGLANQSLLATSKMYINLAAPWVGYAMDDPRMSAVTQLVGCILHVVGNYFVGAGDKVTEQNEMIKVKILTADTPEKVKTMMRSPYKIRASQAEQRFAFQTMELDQKISSQLGLDNPDQWRAYAKLNDRDEYPGKLSNSQKPREQAFKELDSSGQHAIRRLELDFGLATKEQNYERANALCEEISDKLNIPPSAYKEYSQLQAQADTFQALSTEERDTFLDLSAQVSEGYRKLAPEAKIIFDALKTSWENTRHDARHVRERNFAAVSADNQQTLHDILQISASARKGAFSLSPEFSVGFWKGGERRSNSADEVTANFAATQWKTWQWVIGGPYGSLILGAILGVLAAQEKTHDPAYEQPLWQRGAVTGLVGVALLANMIAAYYIMSASAEPNNSKLKLQVAAGTTGGMAEGSFLNHKLDYRDELRTKAANGKYPHVGLIHKNGGNYLARAVKAGLNPQKLFVLPKEGMHAAQARARFDEVIAMLETLKELKTGGNPETALDIVSDAEAIDTSSGMPYKEMLTARNGESRQMNFGSA